MQSNRLGGGGGGGTTDRRLRLRLRLPASFTMHGGGLREIVWGEVARFGFLTCYHNSCLGEAVGKEPYIETPRPMINFSVVVRARTSSK